MLNMSSDSNGFDGCRGERYFIEMLGLNIQLEWPVKD
jgi:hypothetical protein